jgi:hypothetical protein
MASFNLQDYETVEDRLVKFWSDNPNGRIETNLVHFGGGQFIVQAFVYRNADDPVPTTTGYAEETVSNRGVNQTSALENCETSAIGRALANWIYAAKGKRPSRQEMEKVARGTVVKAPTIHDTLAQELLAYSKDTNARKAFVLQALGVESLGSLKELTEEQVGTVLDQLRQGTAPFAE